MVNFCFAKSIINPTLQQIHKRSGLTSSPLISEWLMVNFCFAKSIIKPILLKIHKRSALTSSRFTTTPFFCLNVQILDLAGSLSNNQ